MKNGSFKSIKATHNAYEIIKQMLFESHVIALPDFYRVFEVQCDASDVNVGTVLAQAQKPLAYSDDEVNKKVFINIS